MKLARLVRLSTSVDVQQSYLNYYVEAFLSLKQQRGCDISPITLIKSEQRSTQMGSSARQSRTLKPYLCLRGREDEVINDFCHAPSRPDYA